MTPGKLRARAATILARLVQHQGSLASLLSRQDTAEGDADFPLLQEILFGTCRWYYFLDQILVQLLSKPLKPKDADIRCLLLIGLYQLHHLRVPDYAVVNETVSATKSLGKEWAKGLVNAILRGFLRDQSALVAQAQRDEQGRYAHPAWLIAQLKRDWPEEWQAILTQNNQRPPMTLRVNLQKISRQHFLTALSEAGIDAHEGQLCASSVYLEKAQPVDAIPGFAQGHFSVQDEASQLIPALLEIAPGLHVLDACAAPGGKTCHLLESVSGALKLTALDNDPRRLERVQQNLSRLSLQATLMCHEAQDIETWWDGEPFDRILLDAPCSATGIIRRHPDIKVLRTPEEVSALLSLQAILLRALWQCLSPGGVLVYSTCSVLSAENVGSITSFVQSTPDAKLERIEGQWGVECAAGRQLLPEESGHDGFYFAKLRKVPANIAPHFL